MLLLQLDWVNLSSSRQYNMRGCIHFASPRITNDSNSGKIRFSLNLKRINGFFLAVLIRSQASDRRILFKNTVRLCEIRGLG